MPWTHDDLAGLICDLRLAPYPTLVLGRDLERVRDSAMRRLIVGTILDSEPHRIADEVGPRGTPYARPGGRQWRIAIAVRAASLLSRRASWPNRDIVVGATLLGTLAPGSSRTDPHPLAVQATVRRVLPSQESAVTRAAVPLALEVVQRSVGPLPSAIDLRGAVTLAGYAADRLVPPVALAPPITLPAWADPDRKPRPAADDLVQELSRTRVGTHHPRGQHRAAGGEFRPRSGARYL